MLFPFLFEYRSICYDFLCALFVCGLFICAQKVNGIELNANSHLVVPVHSLSVFEDKQHQYAVDDLLADIIESEWKEPDTASLDFGFNTSTYWVRIQGVAATPNQDWVLEVKNALLDHLTVYFVQDGQVISPVQAGDKSFFNQRSIEHRWFLFDLPKTETPLDVYLQVQTNGVVKLPMTFWQRSAFWQKEQIYLLVKGGFFGLLLVMAIYNLIVGIFIRDSRYFCYVGYVLGIWLYQFSYDGLSYQFLWPESPKWHEKSILIFMLLTSIFRSLFTLTILNLKTTAPRICQLFFVLIAGSIILLPFVYWVPYSSSSLLITLYILPNTILCMAIGVYLLTKGVGVARYFVFGWSLYLVGVIRAILTNIGILPPSFLSEYGIQLGTALEVIVFSIALANRINVERKKRLDAQQESILNLSRFKSLYDNAIEGIFQCSARGVMTSANPAMANMLGYSCAQEFVQNFSGRPSTFFEESQFKEFVEMVVKNGQIKHFELEGFCRNGKQGWFVLSGKMSSSEGEEFIEGFVFDITQRKKNEEQLLYLSRHDPLTGLVNRREFEQHLEHVLSAGRSEPHTLLIMDLDQFKLINDTCGHIAGDELLRQVTIKMRSQTRGGDILSRLGGDEFGVLLMGCSTDDAEVVADKIRVATQDFRFVWDNSVFSLSISIGLVSISSEMDNVKDLLNCGDNACSAAKESGRNRVHVWSADEIELALQKSQVQWATRIKESMEMDFFQLYVQPIVPVDQSKSAKELRRYEVLLRLISDGEIVYPGTFLPAAERYNLMPKLDRWVVMAVFRWLSTNKEKASLISHISINLSGLTLGDQDFPGFLRKQFELYSIPENKICFEITETIAVTNLMNTIQFIEEFRAIGCSFSLDDFGSGFSSYGYLKNLPVDYLKIDGAFVKDMESDKIDCAMVESINRIGQVMGKKTIAEFVENDVILGMLKEVGVDYAQGYGISRPFPIDQIECLQSTGS